MNKRTNYGRRRGDVPMPPSRVRVRVHVGCGFIAFLALLAALACSHFAGC